MKWILTIVPICLFVLSCKKQEDAKIKEQVVIDGRIESGGFAYVFISGSTDYESVIDTSNYFEVVKTHAKVTVWTDDAKEVLILFYDKKYFPPHYYRSNMLRGKAGKTYHLEVIVDGDTITSETTIPQKLDLKTIRYQRNDKDSTKGLIWVGFDDPANETNYYRAFTRTYRKQNQFYATHLSVIDDASFNGKYIEFPLYRGLQTNTDKKVDYRFPVGDTVDVKFCTMDKASFDFWTGYEREMLNGGNPFGADGQNLISNVKGGIGIWSGYGISQYRVIAK